MDFPFPDPPAFGQTLEVASGIHWLRMPLPFALDHINLWLIEDGDGWALVDTGVPGGKSRDLWEGVFAGLMQGRPASRLLVTHFHPDHMGLAGWLTERFGLVMETTQAEWLHGRMLSLDDSRSLTAQALSFYRKLGFSDEQLAMVEKRGNAYGAAVRDIPAAFHRLRQGDQLTIGDASWDVLVGEGHAPEQACLWDGAASVLISGDQVLPSISPNVSVWPSEPDSDPLRLFLTTLMRFRGLPGDALVLPSHGRPFFGLIERIDELIHHHQERLDETLEACGKPISAIDLMAAMFKRPLDTHQLFFAVGESLAHLNYLRGEGLLVRELDAAGVYRFRRA